MSVWLAVGYQVEHYFWLYLWGCFQMRLTFDLVDSIKKIVLAIIPSIEGMIRTKLEEGGKSIHFPSFLHAWGGALHLLWFWELGFNHQHPWFLSLWTQKEVYHYFSRPTACKQATTRFLLFAVYTFGGLTLFILQCLSVLNKFLCLLFLILI